MNLIVAVDENWGIGYKGKLLTYLPDDLKYFKEKTLYKVVVMGRKTLESLPNGKPLANRTNIVLTRDKNYKCDGVTVCNSINELTETIKDYDSDSVFIIGGAQIYNELINDCNKAYVTKIYKEFIVDASIKNIDILPNWELIEKSPIHEYNGTNYCFCVYEKKQGDKY
jgi:dihydrofolate reductase